MARSTTRKSPAAVPATKAKKKSGKSIIILCDGTSNEIKDERTNVVRLYGSIEKTDKQIVFYDPGVGTLGAKSSFSKYWRKTKEIFGLAFGLGLTDNVLECYQFLIENYEEGDKIYLFGFSRGAYTVRVLAAMIYTMGILNTNQRNLASYAYTALSRTDSKKFDDMRLFQRMLDRRPVEIEFLGLWDTVSSMFEVRNFWFRLKRISYTKDNPAVKTIRHALAIDERRIMFRHFYWKPRQKHHTEIFSSGAERRKYEDNPKVPFQDTSQVWFAGGHADSGGGFTDKNSTVCKIAFEWMVGEARDKGLGFDEDVVDIMLGKKQSPDGKWYSKTDPKGKMYDALKNIPLWWLIEVIPQRVNQGSTDWKTFLNLHIPLGSKRTIPSPDDKMQEPDGVLVHDSVKIRKEETDYDPPNLPDDIIYVSNKQK